MADTIETQYMELMLPVPTVQSGPEYAENINAAFTQVDQHDHSTGKGTPVTPAGMNINTDLDFNNNDATELRSTRYQDQSSPISAPTDLNCLYVAGDELYYNDSTGTQVQLTQGGSVAGSSGNITGMVPPAAVVYSPGSQTFTFLSTSATAANLDAGSYKMREVAANALAVTLSSPAALASNYTWTWPAALATSANTFVQIDASGNLSNTRTIDGVKIATSGTTFTVPPRAVTQTLLPFKTPSSAAGVGGFSQAFSCGAYTNATGTYTLVTNQSIEIQSVGRPIRVGVVPASSATSVSIIGSAGAAGFLRLLKNGAQWQEWALSDSVEYGPCNFEKYDLVTTSGGGTAAVTTTYQLQGKAAGAGTLTVTELKLIAYEI